jgi:hypothetical protein
LQKEIESLNNENFESVWQYKITEIGKDVWFFLGMISIAKSVRPRNAALYETVFWTFLNQRGLPTPVVTDESSSSEFLDILKTDDVSRFRSQWQSCPLISNAVPVAKWLIECLRSLHLPDNLDPLPLSSVAAFYGAENCLKFLIANHLELVQPHISSHDPLCFAIAGGNMTIVKILFEYSCSQPKVPIVFAVHSHQEEIFQWLMQKSDHTVIDEWLLLASVSTRWYYGLSYCINNGINTNHLPAIRCALKSVNTPIF